MSGICGFFSVIPNKHLLAQFNKTMEQNVRGEYKSVSGDFFKFINVESSQNENKELHKENCTQLQIITHGEAYNENAVNLDETILDLYKNDELARLQDFNGSFLAAIYDEKKCKAVLVNDRFGTVKTYYHYNSGTLYFTPKIKLLLQLGAPKSLRMESIYDFFLFGYPLGDKTLFKDIFQLPPASIVEMTEHGLKFTKYWDVNWYSEYDSRPVHELVDELYILWQQAVERRVDRKNNNLIFLSGGLDSRAILAASLKSIDKEKLHTVTYGHERSLDFKLGRLIA
ncbi:MAG: asparagine synthase-related protein, partial [Thermodesulfobacteriota bacterium]|nr:asparagine synthase-related protein [Thermodesulfobacteriota bacterium]